MLLKLCLRYGDGFGSWNDKCSDKFFAYIGRTEEGKGELWIVSLE